MTPTLYRLLLVLMMANLMLTAPTAAVIAEQGTSTACNTITASTSLTCSHDSGSGSNRLTICGVSLRSEADITATYAGVSMTRLMRQDRAGGTNASCHWFYLANPMTGSNDAVSTLPTAQAVLGCITLSGVDQSTPIRASGSADGSGTTATLGAAITSATGDLVVDVVAKIGSTGSLTAAGGQAEEWDDVSEDGTAGNNIRGGGSTKAGAATVNTSWALGETNGWTLCVASVAPAADPVGGEALQPILQ